MTAEEMGASVGKIVLPMIILGLGLYFALRKKEKKEEIND